MIIYITFFFLAIAPVVISRGFGYKNNIYAIIFASIIPLLFSSLRGDVGTDTIAYKTYYEQLGLSVVGANFEPTFFILSLIGNFIGLNSQYLIVTVGMLQFVATILVISKVKEKDVLYFVLLTTFFVYINMNLIRAGTALYFTGLAYLYLMDEKVQKSWIVFFAGCVTHISSFILAPAFFRKTYVLVPASVVALYMGYEFSTQKIANYTGNYGAFVQFSGGIGFFVVSSILYYIVVNQFRKDKELIIVITFATIIKFLSFFIPILDRFSTIFYFIGYLRMCYFGFNEKNRILVYILCAYGLYGTLLFISTSDDAMYYLLIDQPGLAELYKDTRWLPYRFFWQ